MRRAPVRQGAHRRRALPPRTSNAPQCIARFAALLHGARLRRGAAVRRTTPMVLGTLARVLAVAALAASDDRVRTADALLDLLAVDADAAAPQADAAQEQRERAAAADRIFEALDGILPQAQLDVARELRGLAR